MTFACLGEQNPKTRPSSCTTTLASREADDLPDTPNCATSLGIPETSTVCVAILHLCARWLSNPHGLPSGVWTGHRNPQLSGNSFRTVVVLSWAKKAPLCT